MHPCPDMCYQSSLHMLKTITFEEPNFEAVIVLNQMTFSSRQTLFLIFRDNTTKIGMNTTAKIFYQLTGKITLNSLNLSFVHYKKINENSIFKISKDIAPNPEEQP